MLLAPLPAGEAARGPPGREGPEDSSSACPPTTPSEGVFSLGTSFDGALLLQVLPLLLLELAALLLLPFAAEQWLSLEGERTVAAAASSSWNDSMALCS